MKTDLVQKYIKENKVAPATFDPVFKSVLKDPSTRDYLVNLINHITSIPKAFLKENIYFKDNEPAIERALEKGKRVDLLIDVEHMKINIELNMEYYEGILEKSHTYAHKIAGMIYNKSENYKNKHIIIQININNFDVLGDENADTIRECRILDVKTNQLIDKQFIIYHVNLDKILKKYYNEYRNEELTEFEKSLVILTLEDKSKLRNISKGDRVLMSVEKKIEDLSLNEEIIGLYDAEQEDKRVYNTKLLYATEQATKKGLEQGIQQGIQQGMQQGMQQGLKQGSRNEKISIAKKLLEENIDINIISNSTGLTIKEISDLNNEL